MERREKRAKEIVSLATELLEGKVGNVVNRTLDYFDDLDGAIDFFVQWRRGSLLGLEPGERSDRWGITVRLQDLIEQDPALRQVILRHPRYVVALAFQEAAGIRILDFLSQVKSITIAEEEPGLHWLILPECHHGCEVVPNPESHLETDSCQVCGNPKIGCSRNRVDAIDNQDRIQAIDDTIIRMSKTNPTIHARLQIDPFDVFTQVAFTLYGVHPQEEFGIRAVKVGCDSETSLYIALLARHECQKRGGSVSTPSRRLSLPVGQ